MKQSLSEHERETANCTYGMIFTFVVLLLFFREFSSIYISHSQHLWSLSSLTGKLIFPAKRALFFLHSASCMVFQCEM